MASQCQDTRHAEPHRLPCTCCTEHCDPQEWVEIEEDQTMNTQDDAKGRISIPVNVTWTPPVTVSITRAELIYKMAEWRVDDWDTDDTEEVLRYGRIGFNEMPNEELEEIANECYCMTDADGNEVRYTITDADTSKPPAEALLKEAVKALHAIKSQSIGDDWTAEQAIAFIKQHATEAIAKAEWRA